MHLEQFNAADAAEAAAVVRVWADIPWWIDAVVSDRPYADVDALAAHASLLAGRWGAADLEAALAHHPRIGERPAGGGAEAEASRSEQSSMDAAAGDIAARIAAGNADYEARFGRVFLVRAAGRSPEQMLAELERRLRSDPATEEREAAGQLAEIALLRLRSSIDDGPAVTGIIDTPTAKAPS